jgi:hypothetical protein
MDGGPGGVGLVVVKIRDVKTSKKSKVDRLRFSKGQVRTAVAAVSGVPILVSYGVRIRSTPLRFNTLNTVIQVPTPCILSKEQRLIMQA